MPRPAKQEEVSLWLKRCLAQGSRPYQDIKNAASALGYSPATLNRAKPKAGIESVRRGRGYHRRDPDVLEEQVGSPNLVTAIQELTLVVRQLAKGSTLTAANVLT